jgi:hypothetical protein
MLLREEETGRCLCSVKVIGSGMEELQDVGKAIGVEL